MNPYRIAAAGDHVDIENGAAIHGTLADGGVRCVGGGVAGIGINFRNVFAGAKEAERELGIAFVPVRDRADVPIVAASACE